MYLPFANTFDAIFLTSEFYGALSSILRERTYRICTQNVCSDVKKAKGNDLPVRL